MKHNGILGLSLVILLLSAACNQKNRLLENTALDSITGTVNYRARIALPANAEITVQLQDVSLADAPAITLSEQTIVTKGEQVPISFRLAYNPLDIKPGHTYSVRARINIDGQLCWINTTTNWVINGGPTKDIAIWVEQV